jgi:dihydroorotase
VLGGVRAGWAPLESVIAALTTGPARILGVPMPQGDRVVIETEAEWVVTPESLFSLGKNTPLMGRSLRGRVDVAMVGRPDREGGGRVAEAISRR